MKVRDLLEWSKPTPKSIKDHLVNLGYKKLGNGVDQTAFLAPDGSVLKVFNAGKRTAKDGFSKDHLMFKKWVTYCENNKSNQFLPKFFGWEAFEWEGSKYLQIKMERLAKLPYSLSSALESLTNMTVYASKHQTNTLKSFYNTGDIEELIGIRMHYDNVRDEISKLIILLGKDELILLVKTLVELNNLSKEYRYTLDLHGGNFMHRNDGVPIIVDPWVVE